MMSSSDHPEASEDVGDLQDVALPDDSSPASPSGDAPEDLEDANDGEGKDQLYKVLVIGDYGVGKTSVIRRYTEGYFSPNYKLTIGVDFALKKLSRDGDQISLQLWDIAGHERFGHMTRVYYKYAIAAIIVFDLGRPATFESVLKWHKDLNEKVMLANGEHVPTILLANKCDLSPAEIDKEKLDSFCEEHGFLAWFATSAKLNKNIEEAMNEIVEAIQQVSDQNCQPSLIDREAFVKMDSPRKTSSSDGKCCS